MKVIFRIEVEVDHRDLPPGHVDARHMEGLPWECHKIVSALVTAYKYHRVRAEADVISTHVEVVRVVS